MMLLFLATFASAQNFEIKLRPISEDANRIFRDEVAEFDLTIINNNNYDDRYLVYSEDSRWRVDKPFTTSLQVPKNSQRVFRISVSATSAIPSSGMYVFKLATKSVESDVMREAVSEILIKSEQHRDFLPSISAFVRINEGDVVDPRDDVELRLTLINRNALNIPKILVFIESSYFKETYETSLQPNSELIKTFTFPIDPYVQPQEDTVKIQINYDGRIITDRRITYNIQENNLLFTRDPSESSKLFLREYNVSLQNLGNVPRTEVFSYEIGRFASYFTKTYPESRVVISDDSTRSLEFSIKLDPANSTNVSIVTDYRFYAYPLIILIILILLITGFYYLLRTPIVVTKKATVVTMKDGGTSEIKILLNLRNRTGKIYENISVVDRIPDITQIEEEFSIGTLKPTKIVKNSKKGTIIKWNFPSFEGYEERIITYKIHSRLGILGEFTLPAAVVKFDTPSGKTRAVKSKSIINPDK